MEASGHKDETGRCKDEQRQSCGLSGGPILDCGSFPFPFPFLQSQSYSKVGKREASVDNFYEAGKGVTTGCVPGCGPSFDTCQTDNWDGEVEDKQGDTLLGFQSKKEVELEH